MKSNWLHRIFQKKSPLTRKDIQDYGSSDDHTRLHEIETKISSDPFSSDAMEGWESVQHDTSIMKAMDQRFGNNNSLGLLQWIGIGTTITLLTFLTLYIYSTPAIKNQEQNQTQKLQTITIEATDIVLDEKIEELPEHVIANKIKTQFIKEDAAAISETHSVEIASSPIIEIDELPILEPTNTSIDVDLAKHRIYGKEVYLNDLKLVDYRKYRSKPEIKVKHFVLSGTPANQEDENSIEYDSAPQYIDISYYDYINKTMALFNREKFKKALSRFEVILETYNDDINAHFYIGLCYYNFDNYDQAIKHFDQCIISYFNNFEEEALWLKALCLEESGKLKEAKEIFKNISKSNGFYQKQAMQKL